MPVSKQQPDIPLPVTGPEPVRETTGDPVSLSAESLPPMPAHPPAIPVSRWSQLSRGTALAIGAGLGAAVVGACWAGVSLADQAKDAEGSFSTHGTLTVSRIGVGLDSGEPCSGTGGYSDISFGTQVTITDAAGTLVAMGNLSLGRKTKQGCEFPFTVDDITPGSKFYTVEISRRGGLTKTEDQLRAGELAFTLGD